MNQRPILIRLAVATGCTALFLSVWPLCGGCSRDVRLAGRKVTTVNVRPVTMYGLNLDQSATPEQVVFAALQAIRDDFHAKSDADREAALARQFDLCAANVIKQKEKTSISGDEFVYNVVYRWTPTIAHYIPSFPADAETARAKLVRRPGKQPDTAQDSEEIIEVAMEADDPSGNPTAKVVLIAWLAKDNNLWRILHFGFDRTRRTLSDTAGSQPAPPRPQSEPRP
jgi:hypothetical protein